MNWEPSLVVVLINVLANGGKRASLTSALPRASLENIWIGLALPGSCATPGPMLRYHWCSVVQIILLSPGRGAGKVTAEPCSSRRGTWTNSLGLSQELIINRRSWDSSQTCLPVRCPDDGYHQRAEEGLLLNVPSCGSLTITHYRSSLLWVSH